MGKKLYQRRVILIKDLTKPQWESIKRITQYSNKTHSEGVKHLIDNSIAYKEQILKLILEKEELLQELQTMYSLVTQHHEVFLKIQQFAILDKPRENTKTTKRNSFTTNEYPKKLRT